MTIKEKLNVLFEVFSKVEEVKTEEVAVETKVEEVIEEEVKVELAEVIDVVEEVVEEVKPEEDKMGEIEMKLAEALDRVSRLEEMVAKLMEVSVQMNEEFSSIKKKPAGAKVEKSIKVNVEQKFENKPNLAKLLNKINK